MLALSSHHLPGSTPLAGTERAAAGRAMDILRKIASEGEVEQRTVFMIEELFRVRRVGFEASGFLVMPPELDLLEEGDRNTHNIRLEDGLDAQLTLDIFQPDPDFEAHEAEWEVRSLPHLQPGVGVHVLRKGSAA